MYLFFIFLYQKTNNEVLIQLRNTFYAAALLLISLTTKGQVGAQELGDFPVEQLEKGQAIDTYGEFTLVGSKFGKGLVPSAAMLFKDDELIRKYSIEQINNGIGFE